MLGGPSEVSQSTCQRKSTVLSFLTAVRPENRHFPPGVFMFLHLNQIVLKLSGMWSELWKYVHWILFILLCGPIYVRSQALWTWLYLYNKDQSWLELIKRRLLRIPPRQWQRARCEMPWTISPIRSRIPRRKSDLRPRWITSFLFSVDTSTTKPKEMLFHGIEFSLRKPIR